MILKFHGNSTSGNLKLDLEISRLSHPFPCHRKMHKNIIGWKGHLSFARCHRIVQKKWGQVRGWDSKWKVSVLLNSLSYLWARDCGKEGGDDVFFPIFFLSSICFQNVSNECISVVYMFVQCKQWTHLKEIRLEIQENVFLYQGHSQFANISWLFPGPVVMKRFHALHMYLSKSLITTCMLIPTCHSIIHKNQLNCPFLTTMTQTRPSKRGRI